MWLIRAKVQNKVLLALVMASILMGLLGGYVSMFFAKYVIEKELFDKARTTVASLEFFAKTARDITQIQRYISAISAEQGIVDIELVSYPDQKIISSSRFENIGKQLADISSVSRDIYHRTFGEGAIYWDEYDSGIYLLAKPVQWITSFTGGYEGALIISFDAKGTMTFIASFALASALITTLMIFFISMMAMYILWKLVLKNTDHIFEVVQQHAAGDEAAKCNITTKDEFGVLGRAINEMFAAEAIAKQRMLDAKIAAETLAKEKVMFLAKVSHELRTPLTSIHGYTEQVMFYVQKPAMEKKEVMHSLEVVHTNTEYLLRLINDLLDASKLDHNMMQLELVHFDFLAIVDDVVKLSQAQLQKHNVKLEVECNDNYLYAVGDPLRIKQIIINLVSNAIKFSPQGKVIIRLRNQQDAGVCVEVADSGIGMKEDELDKLFTSFTQANSSISSKYGGTGMGLYITKKLVELMDGRVTIDSTYGHGTKMAVFLPLELLDEKSFVPSVTHQASNNQEVPSLNGNVVVVDDMQDILDLYRLIIENTGATVQSFTAGTELIAQVKSMDFDLLIMDMHMPDIDGTDLLKELRAQGIKQPAIVVTASLMAEEQREYLQAGFVRCLAKPIKRSELYDVLSTFLLPSDTMKEHTDGDKSQLQEKLAVLKTNFLTSFTARIQVIDDAFANKDFAAIKSEGHKIKGSSGIYGFDKLSEVGGEIEKYADFNDTDKMKALIAELKVTYDHYVKASQAQG